MKIVRNTLLGLVLCFAQAATAELAVPPLTARVTDQTATLTGEQKAALEQTLEVFEQRKGSQIAVLMVATTGEETIEQYSLRVVEQWKLGRKKVDDGALLIIAKDDRKVRIEVGYGLEGALNDATAKRIISEFIVPRFRQGDFHGGITAAIEQMIRVIDGESLPAPAPQSSQKSLAEFEQTIPVLFGAAIVVGGVLRAILGRFLGAVAAGGVVAAIAGVALGTITMAIVAGVIAFILTLAGVRMGGLGGGRGGGRGGFGGGGGGFGGGGASGRW